MSKHSKDRVQESKDPCPKYSPNLADHMANERTFLAWVRTGLGIMALGFVVERFSLFIKQMMVLLQRTEGSFQSVPVLQGYSSAWGLCLVAFGTLTSLFAFIKYKRIAKQIENRNYYPSMWLDAILTFFVMVIGGLLMIYLG